MTREEKEVQRALTVLDPLLFLDKAWSPFGYVYYTVMCQGSPPSLIAEWRRGNTPLPLSLDLIDRVRSQEGDLGEAIASATANNAAKKELFRQQRQAAEEEIIKDWQKSNRVGRITVDLGRESKI